MALGMGNNNNHLREAYVGIKPARPWKASRCWLSWLWVPLKLWCLSLTDCGSQFFSLSSKTLYSGSPLLCRKGMKLRNTEGSQAHSVQHRGCLRVLIPVGTWPGLAGQAWDPASMWLTVSLPPRHPSAMAAWCGKLT